MHKNFGKFELLFALILIYTTLLPFQHFDALLQLSGVALLIWILFLILFRSRNLIAPGVLFHFSVILSFSLRMMMLDGIYGRWFFWIALAQWAATLHFHVRRPTDIAAPSLFLIACLVSPFAASILNAPTGAFPGFWIWTLLVLRATWLSFENKNSPILVPWYVVVFLALSACAIPFSLYLWRSLQFFVVNTVCILLFAICAGRKENRPLLYGYLCTAITMIIFAYSRETSLLRELGSSALKMRLSIVQFHNDLVPSLLIISTALLFFQNQIMRVWPRRIMILSIPLVAVLVLLTYSRSGWISYTVFGAVYILSRGKKKVILAVVLVIAMVFFFSQAFKTASIRIKEVRPIEYRLFNMQTGVRAVEEHPFFGGGWMNYYEHCKQPQEISGLKKIYQSQMLTPEQNHSMILDLAEAAGIPFAACFLLIMGAAIAVKNDPGMKAGLVGLTINSLTDSAAIWLPAYPHIWILLGIAGVKQDVRLIQIGRVKVLVSILLIFSLALIFEDHSLQIASFDHRIHHDDSALTIAQLARAIAPLDTKPLEFLRDLALTNEDAVLAESIAHKIISLRKDYAPDYAELGRIQLLNGAKDDAASSLRTAIRLDPYNALDGKTYYNIQLLPSSDEHRRKEEFLYRIFLLAFRGNLLPSERSLWTLNNISKALKYADRSLHSKEDWTVAMINLYNNCRVVGKTDLEQLVLEHALQSKRHPDDWDRTTLALALLEIYISQGNASAIDSLKPLAKQLRIPLLQARLDIYEGKLIDAKLNLEGAADYYNPAGLMNVWIAYYYKLNRPDELRKYLRLLEIFPSTIVQPWWRENVAQTYYKEHDYENAAREFHHLATCNYSEPLAHYREARLWWLAGNAKLAQKANAQLQRLISRSWITENLYRSRFEKVIWQGNWISNFPLPNAYGGYQWRTAVFVHPPFRVQMPHQDAGKSIRTEVALAGDVWGAPSDGVRFTMLGGDGIILNSVIIDPNNSLQRQWIAFDCQMKNSGNLTLMTDSVQSSVYDWALWSFE